MNGWYCLADELDAIAEAGMVTSRYAGFSPEFGVPVRTTIGEPKFWKPNQQGQLETVRALAPWDRRSWTLPTEVERRAVYVERLDRHGDAVVRQLAAIARRHPGERLVLLCFEPVGEECHRRWAASWFEERHGLVVPELPAEPVSAQLRFPL